MKNLFFSSIIIFIFNLNAQERKNFTFKSASLITSYNKEVVEYKFKSLNDLKISLEEIINELNFNGNEKVKKESCSVTLMIRVEIALGTAEEVLLESITTGCTDDDVKVATKKLQNFLIDIAIK